MKMKMAIASALFFGLIGAIHADSQDAYLPCPLVNGAVVCPVIVKNDGLQTILAKVAGVTINKIPAGQTSYFNLAFNALNGAMTELDFVSEIPQAKPNGVKYTFSILQQAGQLFKGGLVSIIPENYPREYSFGGSSVAFNISLNVDSNK